MEDSGSDTGEANLEDDHAEGSGGDTVQEAAHDSDDAQPAAWKVAGDVEVANVDKPAVLDVDKPAVLDVDMLSEQDVSGWQRGSCRTRRGRTRRGNHRQQNWPRQ